MTFIDSLQLQSSACIHLNLPKNLLKRHGFADALLDELVVQNGKTQCYDSALIAPRTCAIPVYQDETRLYDEIHVIEYTLKSTKTADKLEAEFFKQIPYALILVAHCDDTSRISLAHFRANAADKSQNVITDTIQSQWFDDNSPFPLAKLERGEGVACISKPGERGEVNLKSNLFAFYSAIFDAIVLQNARQVWSDIELAPSTARSLLRQYDELQNECAKLQAAAKKPDLPFAKKCMLSQQIQQIKSRIEQLPNQNKDELVLSNGDSHSKTLF